MAPTRFLFARVSLILSTILFAACSAHKAQIVRDSEGLKASKRIVVLPFFSTQKMSSEYRQSGILGTRNFKYTMRFATALERGIGKNAEVIWDERVEVALSEIGGFVPHSDNKKDHRTGFSIAEALEVGRILEAETILLGAYTLADTMTLKQHLKGAVTVRALRVADGKVLWGGSAISKWHEISLFDDIAEMLAKAL